MQKRVLVFLSAFLLLMTFAAAANIEIKLDKNVFQQNEKVGYTILLFDDANSQIQDQVNIEFIDATEIQQREQTVNSNEHQEMDLGVNANYGYWKIIATYKGQEVTRIFSIQSNDEIKLEIINDELVITNIGNIFYSKTVQIVIGSVVEAKEVKLGIGQSTSLKLLAPEGNYNVQVTDGKNSISKQDVFLSGEAVAVLSQEEQGSSIITGINGDSQNKTLKEAIKESKVALFFIFAIFALFILIVVQRLKESSH